MKTLTTFETPKRNLEETADEFARFMSVDGTRFQFDFSIKSISEVESFLDSVVTFSSNGEENYKSLSYSAAVYVGEVVERNNLGTWIDCNEEPDLEFETSLIIRTKFAIFEPWNWTYKRLQNGIEDNIVFKFKAMVLGDPQPLLKLNKHQNVSQQTPKKSFLGRLFELP